MKVGVIGKLLDAGSFTNWYVLVTSFRPGQKGEVKFDIISDRLEYYVYLTDTLGIPIPGTRYDNKYDSLEDAIETLEDDKIEWLDDVDPGILFFKQDNEDMD